MINIIISLIFLILLVLALYTVFYGAPFVVTDKKTIEKIIKLSGVKKGDKIVDLGSGDGRIVIEFARRGIEAHGYEINLLLYLISLIKAKALGLKNAHFHLGDFWKANLRGYDVIIVYGISYIMARLEKKVKEELKKGTVVITHAYNLPKWKPVNSDSGIYMYVK